MLELHPIFYSQTLTYLKQTHIKLELLINFNSELIKHGIHRIVNKLLMNKTILFLSFSFRTSFLPNFQREICPLKTGSLKIQKIIAGYCEGSGNVHLDLMNNKIIPDPFKDENEQKYNG
jgi:hypothetical protein